MNQLNIQYISDNEGTIHSVVVPIDVWRELESELETKHLLRSEKMKQRLLESIHREEGFSLEDVHEKLGI